MDRQHMFMVEDLISLTWQYSQYWSIGSMESISKYKKVSFSMQKLTS